MGCGLQRMPGMWGKRFSDSWSLTARRKVNLSGVRRRSMLRGAVEARGRREAANGADA
jgi:hypothetical protein